MKLTRTKKLLALAVALANGWLACAQSGGVPGPTDYGRFSTFITDRNIFDPSRYPHSSSSGPSHYRSRPQRNAPAFSLVGTMSYRKGMFAFFDGNNPDLRKVLYPSDGNTIAGYTLTEITLTGVKLQSADKKQTVEMNVGDVMRQEDNTWRLAGQGDLAADTATTESAAPATDNSSAGADSSPPSAGAPNDILKKLMQQREQELK